jgi:hypothetical protein
MNGLNGPHGLSGFIGEKYLDTKVLLADDTYCRIVAIWRNSLQVPGPLGTFNVLHDLTFVFTYGTTWILAYGLFSKQFANQPQPNLRRKSIANALERLGAACRQFVFVGHALQSGCQTRTTHVQTIVQTNDTIGNTFTVNAAYR